ncbi:MAG: tRNA (cytidine(56)-2'-O)-methyltransferase [Nitrosopumilus sp.]|uniref:tRNA (cytidine(56)-2'-O)-methyltransferase n=1 Tax=Nitrosopumilus zosterae TaxID=718286 RepID=A0A2S2KT09_9ARCH|nr:MULTISPECIES: tRNA (cytidine(56)-2'-O)-methyltransferase [Nitrosopumilus]MCV0365874.1 tRNA (cytidine(56)-2'-O)-methyltransferase [Nitrosopumilus sp.]BDQ30086.1 tRNA (cytidine(56)-2'-O)-methyltransferase [Nitrosopumilus zosterae]GBH34810.1 tRNA (cytidine(56)-2'-O)-methyltransferase [Nitrosopumilus zosterae]
MIIEVLRIGQRLVRDDRVTTHVALVSRAFGAERIFMNEVNPEIKDTVEKINKTWGGKFEVEFIDKWKNVVKKKKEENFKIIHLSMYGQNINNVQEELQKEKNLLIVVGAEKVPREIYELADYNVGIGSQPHSEISALAILLDRIQKGGQFEKYFANAKRKIIPTKNGKNVQVEETRD